MRFRVLLGAHDPCDPAEATLVLVAAAAMNGLQGNGELMSDGMFGRFPTLAELAEELGLHIGAIRRGFRHLQEVGDAHRDQGGVAVLQEALRRRWENPRQRIRLTAEARTLRMRSEPLLLTALVAGQVDRRGQLMLGVEFLAERTGFARRTVERTLARAKELGAIHTWSRFTQSRGFRQQLWIALGPSRSGGSRASQDGGSGGDHSPTSGAPSHEPAVTPSRSGGHPLAKRRSPPREVAVTPSRSGGRHPDCHPDYHQDHHPDRAAARRRTDGDTAASSPLAPAAPEPQPAAVPAATRQEIHERNRKTVEAWVMAFAKKGIRIMEPRHAVEVAGLLDQLSPPPETTDRHRLDGLRRERRELGLRVIAWCPSPERLGRWLVRASRWFGVQNLGAYLRRAVEKGDPGTLLNRGSSEGHFTPATERQLEGPHVDNVARIVGGGALLVSVEDEADRTKLREQLRSLLKAQRPAAARAVLLQLIGRDRSDIAIAKAIGDACTLAQAKELLAA